MKISRDALHKRTKGELSRLFNAAQADLSRQPRHSEARHETQQTLKLIRQELARRELAP